MTPSTATDADISSSAFSQTRKQQAQTSIDVRYPPLHVDLSSRVSAGRGIDFDGHLDGPVPGLHGVLSPLRNGCLGPAARTRIHAPPLELPTLPVGDSLQSGQIPRQAAPAPTHLAELPHAPTGECASTREMCSSKGGTCISGNGIGSVGSCRSSSFFTSSSSAYPSASHDRDQDSLKPVFHVMPVSGWGSDPNGPIFYRGRYHLFYQACPGTCQWHWGVGWEHVVSYDLAHWERLPPAIFPTPGGPDADGCFSGSIAVEPHTGVPVCFYTGARLRTNTNVPLPHPPPSHDMGLPHFESQCCAVCDPDDELLVRWRKVPMPLMELPHTGQLTAWRDPWFVEQGDGRGREWTMLIGSGIKGGGGTALVYRTQDITRGWRFVGELCRWPDPKMGVVWECPFLVQLQPLPLCAHVLPTTDLAVASSTGVPAGLTPDTMAAPPGTLLDSGCECVMESSEENEVEGGGEDGGEDESRVRYSYPAVATSSTAEDQGAVGAAAAEEEVFAAEAFSQDPAEAMEVRYVVEAIQKNEAVLVKPPGAYHRRLPQATITASCRLPDPVQIKPLQVTRPVKEIGPQQRQEALVEGASGIRGGQGNAGGNANDASLYCATISMGNARIGSRCSTGGTGSGRAADRQSQGGDGRSDLDEQYSSCGCSVAAGFGEPHAVAVEIEALKQSLVTIFAAQSAQLQPSQPEIAAHPAATAIADGDLTVFSTPGDAFPNQTVCQQEGTKTANKLVDPLLMAMVQDQECGSGAGGGGGGGGSAGAGAGGTSDGSVNVTEHMAAEVTAADMASVTAAVVSAISPVAATSFLTCGLPAAGLRAAAAAATDPKVRHSDDVIDVSIVTTAPPISLAATVPQATTAATTVAVQRAASVVTASICDHGAAPETNSGGGGLSVAFGSVSSAKSQRKRDDEGDVDETAQFQGHLFGVPSRVVDSSIIAPTSDTNRTALLDDSGADTWQPSPSPRPPSLPPPSLPPPSLPPSLAAPRSSLPMQPAPPPLPLSPHTSAAAPEGPATTPGPHCPSVACTGSLISSNLTASATVSAAAAAARAVLQDLHSMVKQVMEAHRARVRATAAATVAAAAASEDDSSSSNSNRDSTSSVGAGITAMLRCSSGLVGGHSALPKFDAELKPLPGPITMRYHKAEPLWQTLSPPSEAAAMATEMKAGRFATAVTTPANATNAGGGGDGEGGSGVDVSSALIRTAATTPDLVGCMRSPSDPTPVAELSSSLSAPLSLLSGSAPLPAQGTAAAPRTHSDRCQAAAIAATTAATAATTVITSSLAEAAVDVLVISQSKFPAIVHNAAAATEVVRSFNSSSPAAAAAAADDDDDDDDASNFMPLHADVGSATSHAYATSLPPSRRWLFGNAPDACHISGDLVGTRPIYWLGEYDNRTAEYDITGAIGAAPLDIGNCLYAPACFQDPQGRHILWGYMKELRRVPPAPALCDKYSYAGCVSLPRALYLRGEKLFQLPLPELTALRSDVAVHVSQVTLTHGWPWRLSGVRGLHLDIELAVSPGSAQRTAVLLHSWRPKSRGAAALVYEWTSRRLYVVFEAMHPSRQALWRGASALRTQQQQQQPQKQRTHPKLQHQQQQEQQRHLTLDFAAGLTAPLTQESSPLIDPPLEEEADKDAGQADVGDETVLPTTPFNHGVEDWLWMRREEAGGDLDLAPGAPLRLRLFLDASCLEVFTGTGQVLTTRVYRGHPPAHTHTQPCESPDPGIEVWSVGGSCTLDDLHAYEMESTWSRAEDMPLDGFIRKQ